MPSESPPARKSRSQTSTKAPDSPARVEGSPGLRLFDWTLVASFLALAFLLGVFPLKDTDFWWHLRTGDLIRQTGQVPTTDLYTFTVPKAPWIDLHWLFQVAISWGYQHGGVPALNLAKCVITCAALLLLIMAKKRDWPVSVMLLAWIPALLVLSGRMYVRPETLSLLYLSIDLAVLARLHREPRWTFLLPVVQLAWVNTQGLFVLGPIVIGFALIDAVLRPGAFSEGKKRWWRIVGVSTLLTGVACLFNPYGLIGALYPIQLAGTMGNPVFSENIAELTPIPTFIKRNVGWSNLPLQLHIVTMVLGAFSFLIPMVWTMANRLRTGRPAEDVDGSPRKAGKTKGGDKPSKPRKKKSGKGAEEREPAWSLSIFRLLLFASFSFLSWQATRNSHQFAAVVGSVTAWNFGEWVAAVRARRVSEGASVSGFTLLPRVVAQACLAVLFVAVATGKYYELTAEGREIGLGEESLWYPHDAIKFSGTPGMPERFISFHDGYSGLYDYYNGPERKVFADARLEVIGPEVFERYINLRRRISMDKDESAWSRELDDLGRPAILAGNADASNLGANLMASQHWRCVWFDPIAAVFVHDAYKGVVQAHTVDFAARHFHPDAKVEPSGLRALKAMGKSLWLYANICQSKNRSDLARPLTLLGLDYARRIQRIDPEAADGWKLAGELEATREPIFDRPVPRYRLPLDPVFDLPMVRATYALRRAHRAAPDDFLTLMLLGHEYQKRGMDEATVPLLEHQLTLRPINQEQQARQVGAEAELAQMRARMGPMPSTAWKNLGELDQVVTHLLDKGRAESAATLLESAYPAESRPWDVADRIATLRLHLGETEAARALWGKAVPPPQPAIRPARIAISYLAEGAFEEARKQYQEALRLDPNLFEARYGLAVLEQDEGRANEALTEARKAVGIAPDTYARSAAEAIVSEVVPYTSR